jgi:hypothetical protein
VKATALGFVTVVFWLIVAVIVGSLIVIKILVGASRIVWQIATFISRNLFVRFL